MKNIHSGIIKLTTASVLVAALTACGGADERKTKYLEKGKGYLEQNNLNKARVEFKNVMQIDPKYADAYFYMGQLEEKNKELGKALNNYKKAIQLDPKFTEAKIKLAKIYVIAGTDDFLKQAKKLLKEVKQEQPNNTETKLVFATIEYKDGNKLKAKKILEEVVEEGGRIAEGISLLASIYLHEGNDLKAEALLVKGVSDNPDNVELRIYLARSLAKNKDFSGAEKYLKEAINIEPEKYSLQFALASLYSASNQLDKAESVLRKAIEKDDEDAQRYLVLVEMLASRVSLDKGDEELKLAIRNKPNLYSLKFAQVMFYEKIGMRDEAKEVLKQIIKDKSYDVEGVNARNQLAKYLLEEGDQQGAKKYVNEVIVEYPNNNDALLITSKLALMNLDADSAINGLRTVVKNNPKSAEASLLLAQAYELNNESSLAENELKKAIEVNPINDQVHVNYARYLGSMGRVDEAVHVLDKALTYFKDSYDLMSLKLKIISSQSNESEVISLLNRMEQANESKPEVNVAKGKYYLSKGKMHQAVEQFEKAYQKSQNKYEPLQLIVRSYMVNKMPEKALERLQKNIDKNPDDAIANLLIGQVFLAQKKNIKAREKFLQALKAADGWLKPYTSLATLYMAEENVDGALAVYQDAITKLKNKVPAQMQIATIYERKSDFVAAMNVYQQILSDNSSNKLAANNYASLLLDQGVESDALKALELVKSFEKMRQPALQDTLAWAYAKTGDNAKAVEILKPIVERSPNIAVFRYHLGYALYHMGDKAASKSHLEIAVSSEQKFPGKDKAAELLKLI